MKDILLNPTPNGTDLAPLFAGMEHCHPGHRYGPHVRPYYLIHFCLSGCGTLSDKHGTHHIKAGELFVIRPGEVTVYKADEKDPWSYCWVAFQGNAAKVFDTAPSVFRTPDEIGFQTAAYVKMGEGSESIYLSLLFKLLYHLFQRDTAQEAKSGIAQICRYIDYNYMKPLQVAEIAHTFGYERSYLYRLFRHHLGIGIKEYITALRMKKAREFLRIGHSVCDTARMVGYGDEFNFSRNYKKHFGTAPSQEKRT